MEQRIDRKSRKQISNNKPKPDQISNDIKYKWSKRPNYKAEIVRLDIKIKMQLYAAKRKYTVNVKI